MSTTKLPYPRKTYWKNAGLAYLVGFVANWLLGSFIGYKLARFAYLGVLAYWIVIEIRRFHDANKSGWLALINLIPGIGTFAALIVAGVMESDYYNNRWLNQEDNDE